MSIKTLTTILRYGGVANLVGSPLAAVFFHWMETVEDRPVAGFPVWIYSFFYCTTILGLMYLQTAKDPVRYRSLLGVAVVAKLWGVLACAYAAIDGYPWFVPLGVYDIGFGVFFFLLYRRLTPAEARSESS